MANTFVKPHLNIGKFLTRRDFSAPSRNQSGSGLPRNREEHGVKLREELQKAFLDFESVRPQTVDISDVEGPSGTFLEVELRRGAPIESIERKSKGITPSALHIEENENRTVGLFVPESAKDFLFELLNSYANDPLTGRGRPPKGDFVEPIELFRTAKFSTYYTDDPVLLPEDKEEQVWWEIWCMRSAEGQLDALINRLGGRTAENDRRLYFPETVIVPVLATQNIIEAVLFARFTISEIRRSRDTPTVFLEAERSEQLDWTDDLAERIQWPGMDAPAVCLLDTGVSRAHHLIEPALAQSDMGAINKSWGVDDSFEGHGTSMAGIALHGDLTYPLAGSDNITLQHRLESIKLLPPAGFDPTEESFYGPVTQSAIALPEIEQPKRQRVYCMAISNHSVSGYQPSGWSAALDQAASGTMLGDIDQTRRLIVTATGNAPSEFYKSRLQSPDAYPIDDPAQAWNVITVGGYTDKVEINDQDLDAYSPLSASGDLSPHTRTSISWSGKSAFKPDIVMEAGNRAVSPSGTDIMDADSLGLLSTGYNTGQQPLVPFRATSAAAAAAARLCARLIADHPTYWPETIRGLLIHSAEWTGAMNTQFDTATGMSEKATLIRRYGYGVPNYERATASANNNLALFSQSEIQPYASTKKGLQDCHFYGLPWPIQAIESIGDETVQLKITLSYFIEPNPGFSATIDPYRYQSHGLRFDLRRRDESMTAFSKRVNDRERNRWKDEDGKTIKENVNNVTDNDNWFFGTNSISAGSLHSDIWTGPAARLLTRNMICIHPVGGWWNNRAKKAVRSQKTRYSLIVSLKTANEEIDLHTPIENLIAGGIEITTPF